MGAAPSLGKPLQEMDDETLTAMVEEAYRQDPQRMEKILTVAKMRFLQNGGAVAAATSSTQRPTSGLMPAAAAPMPSAHVAESAASAMPVVMTEAPAIAAAAAPPAITTPPPPEANPTAASADRMAALWSFPGHTLRELRGGSTTKKRSLPTADADGSAASNGVDVSVDEDGYPILYGSCGREKKYARCSVCYFRGARCNTAHYCACCQRPVCVRPRTYPGEEQPKICWNVLHMDKDMIQRVDKRRARKLHAATLLTERPLDSDDGDEPPPLLADTTNGVTMQSSAVAAASAVKQRRREVPPAKAAYPPAALDTSSGSDRVKIV